MEDEIALSVCDFDRRVSAPLRDDEVESVVELVRWFTRRYPTVKERLAYVRRKHAEWQRPVAIRPRSE